MQSDKKSTKKPKKLHTGATKRKNTVKKAAKAPKKEVPAAAPARSMERVDLAPGALLAPLPPAIVTVADGERVNALTVAWVGILSTVPPRLYISVRPSRYSHGMLKKNGEFVVNLASADMAETVDFVGIYTGAKVDKISEAHLTLKPSAKVSVPTVAECPIALECRVFEVMEMGSHDVFMADILGVSAHADLLDGNGKLHYERADLIAYAHGEYYRVGGKVGRFGFSTDKSVKQKRRRSQSSSEEDKTK